MKRALCLLSIFTGLALGVGCEQHPLPQSKDLIKETAKAKDQSKSKDADKQTPPAEPTPEASPAPQFFPNQ